MAIDRRLNAIWLRGSPDYISRMKAMIAVIDILLDSVILETQMVELTDRPESDRDRFFHANGQIGVATFQTGQFIPPGIPAGNHLSSAQFQAALMRPDREGQRPHHHQAADCRESGSTAKIITGDALPILTAISRLGGVNGVSQQVQHGPLVLRCRDRAAVYF